jgi:predicted NUDIX family NTP pyrophosphohydrolase
LGGQTERVPPKPSAGLLLFRHGAHGLEVLLAHPGGPYWADRDDGVWSIVKGEIDDPAEAALDVARREFREETGQPPPDGEPIPLGEVTQRSGKVVLAWAYEGDLDPDAVESNTLEIEWPPRSGRGLTIPEIDRAEWFGPDEARRAINAAQVPFIDRLSAELEGRRG